MGLVDGKVDWMQVNASILVRNWVKPIMNGICWSGCKGATEDPVESLLERGRKK